MGVITTDPINSKKIIKENYEQLYAHTFDNLAEIDQCLQRHNLPRLKQDPPSWTEQDEANSIS